VKGERKEVAPCGAWARVCEVLTEPLTFTVTCNVENIEESEGEKTRFKMFLLLECNGQKYPDDILLADELLDGQKLFSWQSLTIDTLEVMREKMPEWLFECITKKYVAAFDIAATDSDYIPPRNQSDWSPKKLLNAVDKALGAIHAHKPLTLANAADRINARYKLKKPLTGDALRMLLVRHGVSWKELKQREKDFRERKRTQNK
jgi:hypothetical protein